MFMMIDLDFVLPRYLVSLAKNEYRVPSLLVMCLWVRIS